MVVRATKKLLDRVGPPAPVEAASSATLGDWYVTALFWRPQVALFVNERALLPVLVLLAPGATLISRFPPCFAEIATTIGVDRFRLPQEVVAMSEHVLAETASRRTVGVMNEFVHLAEGYRERTEAVDLAQLSLWVGPGAVQPAVRPARHTGRRAPGPARLTQRLTRGEAPAPTGCPCPQRRRRRGTRRRARRRGAPCGCRAYHSICGTYGVSVFAADGITIEELAQRPPLCASRSSRRSGRSLLTAQLRLVAAGLNRQHFTVAFDDLDSGVERLRRCEHRRWTNPYHEG